MEGFFGNCVSERRIRNALNWIVRKEAYSLRRDSIWYALLGLVLLDPAVHIGQVHMV